MEEIDALIDNITWDNWFESLLVLADAFADRQMTDQELVCRFLFIKKKRPLPLDEAGGESISFGWTHQKENVGETDFPSRVVMFVDETNGGRGWTDLKYQLMPLLLMGIKNVIVTCTDNELFENGPDGSLFYSMKSIHSLDWIELIKTLNIKTPQ
ncbi:MAG: hypothetical protein HC888_00695 [Candidatus Competibacteraceae bacterium]|nr:hypothetical protein [Candidatus Competibacteraceae bacterium]